MQITENLKLGEVKEMNDFTKVLRVENGVIYLFHKNNLITNSCFVLMENTLFNDKKPLNRIEIR